MSGRHGSSRRRAYGRRQKALRDRHDTALDVDLEGPASWPRGSTWDPARTPAVGAWRAPEQGRQSSTGGGS